MYLSKTKGIGGTIKGIPEDFLVEEIMIDGTILELNKNIEKEGSGKFTHFVLQKKNWTTSSALLEIAKRLQVGQKRIDCAGSKDKKAITTQLVSAYNVPPQKILDLTIMDMKILGAWGANDKVRLGKLLGNRFSIKVKGATNEERVEQIATELNGVFPNYFGNQRFGSSRKNTHKIGKLIIEEKFEDAVMLFLCDYTGEINEESRNSRKNLAESLNYNSALKEYPKHLRLERKMIAYLAKKSDPIGALKSLPRQTLLLFIHAYQSQLFNELLARRIKNGLEVEEGEYFCGETLGFPDITKAESSGWICGKLIGYQTPINKIEKEILECEGIDKDCFRIPKIPEISSKGTYRTLLAPLKNFSFQDVFKFELPSGSYATVAISEFTKGE